MAILLFLCGVMASSQDQFEVDAASSELTRITLWYYARAESGASEWCYALKPQLYPDSVYERAVTLCDGCTFRNHNKRLLAERATAEKLYAECLTLDKHTYNGCISVIVRGDPQYWGHKSEVQTRYDECTAAKISEEIVEKCQFIGGTWGHNPRVTNEFCYSQKEEL